MLCAAARLAVAPHGSPLRGRRDVAYGVDASTPPEDPYAPRAYAVALTTRTTSGRPTSSTVQAAGMSNYVGYDAPVSSVRSSPELPTRRGSSPRDSSPVKPAHSPDDRP